MVFRHTRELLKRYRQEGKFTGKIADRIPHKELVILRGDSSDQTSERGLYEKIDQYVKDHYAQYNAVRKGLGFLMEIYRKRLTSSMYAIRKSLEKRYNKLNEVLETGNYGLLVVNQNYQVINPDTKKPVANIYAAGDVIGKPSLASTSMEQARFAMIKAFNLESYKKHVVPILPVGIYTIPECSLAGKTEEECKKDNIEYVIGKASYTQNARGMIIGDKDGFLKLVYKFNPDINKPMKLLGVHIIGEIASELIHIGINALVMNAESNLFIDTCFNYPTLGELYKYATYDAMGNRAIRIG